ncbi:MAG: alkaline phosphatase [Bacteroidetes bacterium]|nr:MAG: alkaline phosphatase [Bacteroidota bacterium]
MKPTPACYYMLCVLILTASCAPSPQAETAMFLGQGLMAGEVSSHSAILQARLTAAPRITQGDMPGARGMLRFAYTPDSSFQRSIRHTPWLPAVDAYDFIAKTRITGLQPNRRYYYRAEYGPDSLPLYFSSIGSFSTLPGPQSTAPVSFVVVTGMNYYHFHFGKYDSTLQYRGPDKYLGYPALESIERLKPQYFIGTGDNVYFDHPAEKNYQNALKNGKHPLPGYFDGKAVTTEAGMRRKYHLQFAQPRFRSLFRHTATYWEKDDHDYRINDSDPYTDFPISHELGIRNFREQLPVVDPTDSAALTYRTHRMSRDLQIWLTEGRDYRSPNDLPDGPEKSLWGTTQREWLKKSLLESTATFKVLISPTPLVGPDDAYKKDNHTNPEGFKYEGDQFFKWLKENGFLQKNFYLICGDRHWQYHAIHPLGFEEFSCGALVDANARAGRLAGDARSTAPQGRIRQLYIQGTPEQASGGFLKVDSRRVEGMPTLTFSFYDEKGNLLYQHQKSANMQTEE